MVPAQPGAAAPAAVAALPGDLKMPRDPARAEEVLRRALAHLGQVRPPTSGRGSVGTMPGAERLAPSPGLPLVEQLLVLKAWLEQQDGVESADVPIVHAEGIPAVGIRPSLPAQVEGFVHVRRGDGTRETCKLVLRVPVAAHLQLASWGRVG
ncbi:MAG: hypothetical protein ABIL09_11730 [Gemmatimonadota bacterium]